MAVDGRAVLVTGASRGIGLATTRALLDRGLTVYAGVRGEPPAELAGAIPVRLDVTDPASVQAAAELIAARQGSRGLHAVVNNAGVIVQGPAELVPDEEWRRQFEINLFGPVRLLRAVLPQLRVGHGRIVNLSAPTAWIGVPFLAPIAASKAAFARLSESMRLELAPWGIPVVDVVPGGTQTGIFATAEQASTAALATADPGRLAGYRPALTAMAKAAANQKLDPVETPVRAVITAVLASKPKREYRAGNARMFAMVARLPEGLRERVVKRAFGLAPTAAAN
jgi:NAD(P)-dependent dehydrogenase (short-subunit alcohol dehydrogenase family)